MEKKYFVNPTQLAAAGATALATAVLAVTLMGLRRPVSALVFLVIAVVFGRIALETGAWIVVNPDGVSRRLFGRTAMSMTWDEMGEVGVAGARIFNKGNPDKTGTLYIYFSRTPMTEEERFSMMLSWPPKDKLYLQHDKYRMDFIQSIYGRKIQKFNTGKVKV